MVPPFLTKQEPITILVVIMIMVFITSEQRLRKAASDVSYEVDKYEKLERIATIDELVQAECECCGLKEECTMEYISKVIGSHSGKWVCGLCSAAVQERLAKLVPKMGLLEAMSSHKEFCQEFNTTTRLNPKLSLTSTMRDIAKKSNDKRSKSSNVSSSMSKIARTSSCFPRII